MLQRESLAPTKENRSDQEKEKPDKEPFFTLEFRILYITNITFGTILIVKKYPFLACCLFIRTITNELLA